jgi:hypothetical protein
MREGEAVLNRGLILTNLPKIVRPESVRFSQHEDMIRGKLSSLEYYDDTLVKFRWVNGYVGMGSTMPYPYPLYPVGTIFSHLQIQGKYIIPYPYF